MSGCEPKREFQMPVRCILTGMSRETPASKLSRPPAALDASRNEDATRSPTTESVLENASLSWGITAGLVNKQVST